MKCVLYISISLCTQLTYKYDVTFSAVLVHVGIVKGNSSPLFSEQGYGRFNRYVLGYHTRMPSSRDPINDSIFRAVFYAV